MDSLSYLRGRRMWAAPDFVVWGQTSEISINYIELASVDGSSRIMFNEANVGQSGQGVEFQNIIDSRGNSLPASILQPKVIIQSKSQFQAFLLGREFSTGFRIARETSASEPITVDLLIIEMG